MACVVMAAAGVGLCARRGRRLLAAARSLAARYVPGVAIRCTAAGGGAGALELDPSFRLQDATFVSRGTGDPRGVRLVSDELSLRPVLILTRKATADDFYRDVGGHRRTPEFHVLGSVCRKLLGSAIGTAHGAAWLRHVKVLKPLMSARSVRDRQAMIHEECAAWVQGLRGESAVRLAGTPSQLRLDRFTLRILSRAVYGEDAPAATLAAIVELATQHEHVMERMGAAASRVPLLGRWADGGAGAFEGRFQAFHEATVARIAAGEFGGGSIVAHLLQLPEESLTREQILGNVDEILLFNIDVMYSAIGAALVNLALRPAVQEQLFAELGDDEAAIRRGLLPEGGLPLLRSFILESARLRPSLDLTFPEAVGEGGAVIGGYAVPAGTVVLADVRAINRDPSVFPDADEFVVDRFVSPSGTDAVAHYPFHRFGLGPRKCLGRHYADDILPRLLALLVLDYRLSYPSGVGEAEAFGPRRAKGGLPFFTAYLQFMDPRIEPRRRRREGGSESSPLVDH